MGIFDNVFEADSKKSKSGKLSSAQNTVSKPEQKQRSLKKDFRKGLTP